MIHFKVNNWDSDYYPDSEPFYTWMDDNCELLKQSLNWDKSQVQVICYNNDMSLEYIVSATEEWIQENCPAILNSRFIIDEDRKKKLLSFVKPQSFITEEMVKQLIEEDI